RRIARPPTSFKRRDSGFVQSLIRAASGVGNQPAERLTHGDYRNDRGLDNWGFSFHRVVVTSSIVLRRKHRFDEGELTMSHTSNQTARAERHARRLAASVAKNRMPAPTQDLEDYLNRFPEDVFVALEGFVEHANTGG